MESPRVARARANALGLAGEPVVRPRRRRGRIAAGVVLLVVSGWLAAVVFMSVGRRQEVLAVAGPVERFEQVDAEDLQVVRVAADPAVGVIPAGRLEDVVGRVAATDLVEGSLLHEGELLESGQRVVGVGEAVVGAVLSAGDSPSNLAAGEAVDVVVRPPAGVTTGAQTLQGWVLSVTDADGAAGVDGQRVSLVVPADTVAAVSAAAAEDRVSVAVLGGS